MIVYIIMTKIFYIRWQKGGSFAPLDPSRSATESFVLLNQEQAQKTLIHLINVHSITLSGDSYWRMALQTPFLVQQ